MGRNGRSKDREVRPWEVAERLSFGIVSLKEVVCEENCCVMGLKCQQLEFYFRRTGMHLEVVQIVKGGRTAPWQK